MRKSPLRLAVFMAMLTTAPVAHSAFPMHATQDLSMPAHAASPIAVRNLLQRLRGVMQPNDTRGYYEWSSTCVSHPSGGKRTVHTAWHTKNTTYIEIQVQVVTFSDCRAFMLQDVKTERGRDTDLDGRVEVLLTYPGNTQKLQEAYEHLLRLQKKDDAKG